MKNIHDFDSWSLIQLPPNNHFSGLAEVDLENLALLGCDLFPERPRRELRPAFQLRAVQEGAESPQQQREEAFQALVDAALRPGGADGCGLSLQLLGLILDVVREQREGGRPIDPIERTTPAGLAVGMLRPLRAALVPLGEVVGSAGSSGSSGPSATGPRVADGTRLGPRVGGGLA